jgi:hypothetical protein
MTNREPDYTQEPSYGVMDALRLVLLFHDSGPWTSSRRAEWLRITGTTEATTKVMCDHVRSALEIGTRCPEAMDGGEHIYGLGVGHVLTEDDVAAIQSLLGDYNDEMMEGTNAFHQGRQAALHEVGGQELLDAVLDADKAFVDQSTAKALVKFRQIAAQRRADTPAGVLTDEGRGDG